jgi:hypothetical protein
VCNQRRWIRRGIEFQTFPTDSPISPGAYIYVDIGLNSWDRITSGVVMAGGALNAPLNTRISDGTYNVLVYKSGGPVQSLSGIDVRSGTGTPSTTYTITQTYNGTPVRGYLYVPETSKSQLDVVVLLHPTIEIAGSTPLDAAQMFLDLAKDSAGLSLGDKILFSVAYPQDSIPGWTQTQANDLFPGINLSNFYFGDNITYVEAALLWAKNSLNAYLTSQGTGKSKGKLFTFGHSQGGLLVHRLNTMHQVDGVIANAPGPIDLLARCQFSEANGDESPSCLKLKTAYGSTTASPSTYNNVSLKNFLSGTLSPALFTQALDDTTGNSAGVPQVQNMQTVVQPGLEACTTCATVTFNYYFNGGHAAFSSNAALQADIRQFVGSIQEPASSSQAPALAPYQGWLFVLGSITDRKRVFRVSEVQMDEEGEVTVKAMEYPCQHSGGKLLSRIADFSNRLFNVV